MEMVATITEAMVMRWAMVVMEVVETADITLKAGAITTMAVTITTGTTKEEATILENVIIVTSAMVMIMEITVAIAAVGTTTEEAPLQLISQASSSIKTLTANKWVSCLSEDA